MLSRAFNGKKTKKSPKYGESSCGSLSFHEDEDCIVGLMGDLPLNFCDGGQEEGDGGNGTHTAKSRARAGVGLCLREVMMSSVQVMRESGLGISEKVVLLDGVVFASKRFRKVTVSKREFGRRVERLAQVSKGSEHLVQVRAYLYAKRIKLVLCDYYPMGSLSDLLDGARDLGHTPLDWGHRLKIVVNVAKAISFIHAQSSTQEKSLQLNVHGNIKASNVLIKTDFTAFLSEYGFNQLAEPAEALGTVYQKKLPEMNLDEKSQKNDIYSFGLMVLDMLGGAQAPSQIHCILQNTEEIKDGTNDFFEFYVEGEERKQALQVLDIALACTNRSPEARPSIDLILLFLGDVLNNG